MKTLPQYEFPTRKKLIDQLNADGVEQPSQVIDYIIAIFQFHKTSETRLYSKLLRPVLGRNYKSVISLLVEGGLINKSKSFITGIMSTSYRLNITPAQSNLNSENRYLNRLLDPTKIYSEDSINQVKQELIGKYKQWIKDTKLNLTKEELVSLPEEQRRYVNDINSGNFWVTNDKNNARIFTPITCLKKELRKKIKIDGEKTCEVDINSSFCQQIYQMQYAFNADKNFRNCVERGDVYSYIGYHIKTDRTKAKLYFNASLNAKLGGWQHPAIIKMFPNLFKSVNELRNTYGNNIISRILQRKEAINVFAIAKELSDKGIKHFTIHDGFLLKKSEVLKAQEIILRHNLKSKVK